jgi:hypothetical protein
MLPGDSGAVPLAAASAAALLHCSNMATALTARLTKASGSELGRVAA